MKTKTLALSSITFSVIFTAIVVAIYAFTVSTVFAQVVPTVDVTVKNQSNTTVTSANIGTIVHANTSVSSSTGPVALGTVDFSLYPNTTCSGTPTNQLGVLLASGVADSATTSVGSSGLSYRVFYNGQQDVYASTTSSCVSVSPLSASVVLNSTLSSTTVMQGTSVYQSATLSGVTANATGTVAYGVYTNNSCSADKVDAGVKTVTNGVVPQSNSIQFNTVGTFYWRADYSGDQSNSSANGPCQSLSVITSSTPPVPPPTLPGTISGTSFNDLNKNKTKDSGEAGIAGFTIRLYGGTFWWNWGKPRAVATTTTDANGNYSFTGLADGLYRVEETKLNGWAQISPDYKWVLIINSKSVAGLDFANIAKSEGNSNSTTTPPRKDDEHKNRGQEKKQEKMEQKELKKQAQRERKISKLWEKINKLRQRGEDRDDD